MGKERDYDVYSQRMRELLVMVRSSPYNRPAAQSHHYSSIVCQPHCGDRITFSVLVSHGIIEDISFQSQGCLLSSAAAAYIAYCVHTKKIEALSVSEEALLAFIGIPVGPNRRSCITMALSGIRKIQEALEVSAPEAKEHTHDRSAHCG